MTIARRMFRRAVTTGIICVLSGSAIFANQEPQAPAAGASPLARAKELYLSADYDQALSLLEGILGEGAPASAAEAAQYRIFCLLALDRGDDAKKAIEALVAADPFFRPSDQASQRIRTIFQDTRKAMLPALVQRRCGRESGIRQEGSAVRETVRSGARAARGSGSEDDAGTDRSPDGRHRVPRPGQSGGRAAARAGTRGGRTTTRSRPAAAAPAPASQATIVPPPDGSPNAPILVRSPDSITPPVPIFQQLPQWVPTKLADRAMAFSGTLVITIDERGNVSSAEIQRSIHPQYDAELLKIAKTWRFKPAMRNGTPTTFEKIVEIQLKPTR
jgi:TonB family protein